MAGVKIPAGVIIDASDIPSVLNNTEGDDYFYYHAGLCGDSVTTTTGSGVEQDSKARRRFDVGDKIAWLANIFYGGSTSLIVDVSFNFRILWKLGK